MIALFWSTRVFLPAVDKNLPFHPGSLFPILSIRGWTSTFRSFRIWRGRPRYLPGNLQTFPGKFCRSVIVFSSILMGKISVFDMLILRPEQSPRKFKILCKCSSSELVGSANIAALPAYNEQRKLAALGSTGLRIPLFAAISMMRCNGSMARMNKWGDKGSPCLNPLACLISSVGCPLMRPLKLSFPTWPQSNLSILCWNPNFRAPPTGMSTLSNQRPLKYLIL